ncbi:hypothetical protein FHS78_000276 [Parvibaculum indicum]|nr:hypothetical protein [Parvibaculum indicum]NIJ40021.1 hypothetical protein [Parvibaculum indicum]
MRASRRHEWRNQSDMGSVTAHCQQYMPHRRDCRSQSGMKLV